MCISLTLLDVLSINEHLARRNGSDRNNVHEQDKLFIHQFVALPLTLQELGGGRKTEVYHNLLIRPYTTLKISLRQCRTTNNMNNLYNTHKSSNI